MGKQSEKMSKLTEKQKAFCREYIIDFNATQSAIRAGYSKKTAGAVGFENLKKPEIMEVIAELIDARAEKAGINAQWVLDKAVELHARCMQAEPVYEYIDGEKVATGEYKFDSSTAARSLELIGKHVDVQAFKERVEHGGEVKTVSEIKIELVKPSAS